MLGDVARRVGLDEEVEMAGSGVGRDGSVGADDFLRLAGNCGGQRDVLPDREAENICWCWQGESIATKTSEVAKLAMTFSRRRTWQCCEII
jgi:hypothetical protein